MNRNYQTVFTLAAFLLFSDATFATSLPDDSFFDSKETMLTIGEPFDGDGVLKIPLKGINNNETRYKVVNAIKSRTKWEHCDEEHCSKPVFTLGLLIGITYRPVKNNHIGTEPFPYELKSEKEETENVPLGRWANVYKISTYQRVDKTEYLQRSVVRQIKGEEEEQFLRTARVCRREWEEFTQ